VLQYRKPKLTRRDPMLSAEGGMGGLAYYGSVGAQLRAARERLGWALPDVAASLRIRYVHLLALEEDRIADLPGLTYAVGFVRSYAQLLGLNPDEMSQRLRAEMGADPKTELEFPAPPPERGVPAGVVVLLGAVLAVGAYVTWYRESGERPSPPPVQVVPDRLVAMTAPPAAGAAPAAQPAAGATVAAKPADARAANAAAQASAPPAAALAAPAVPPTAAAAAVPPRGEDQSGPGAPVKMAALASTGGAAPAASANPQVTLRASADSWVQVRDHKGQILLNRILRAGESWPVPQQPAGQPPLLLTTGNAGGTELVVDGVVSPSLGAAGAVKRDLPLDPALIRDGKLPAQMAASRLPAVVHPQPAQ
jgi:cytoskeleton protein RodZ